MEHPSLLLFGFLTCDLALKALKSFGFQPTTIGENSITKIKLYAYSGETGNFTYYSNYPPKSFGPSFDIPLLEPGQHVVYRIETALCHSQMERPFCETP